MSKISGCALLTSKAIKGKHFNRELSYLVNRSTDNAVASFSFVDRVLHMNHNAIYSSFKESLRPRSKACSGYMIDWQYLLLGYLKQYYFFPKSKS